jgi:hypothetical protein
LYHLRCILNPKILLIYGGAEAICRIEPDTSSEHRIIRGHPDFHGHELKGGAHVLLHRNLSLYTHGGALRGVDGHIDGAQQDHGDGCRHDNFDQRESPVISR